MRILTRSFKSFHIVFSRTKNPKASKNTRLVKKKKYHNQLDIKIGQFTHKKKIDSAVEKIKIGKQLGLMRKPLEVWKTRGFDDKLFRYSNDVYNQKTIADGQRDVSSLSQEG